MQMLAVRQVFVYGTPVLSDVQSKLEYVFRKPELLQTALTHKSFSQGSQDKHGQDNERLEFLGDAVLALVVSEYLVTIFPQADEGELSKIKAFLVSRSSLAKAAIRLELGNWLRLGKGEEATDGRQKSSLLANALEAIIAAVYIDGGNEQARSFILRVLSPEFSQLQTAASGGFRGDYKSHLQELAHKKYEMNPDYRLVQETGPDHQKVFEMEVCINNRVHGRGIGKTKKEAEQIAAREALEKGLADEAQ
ncbi:MAG: ribonuclease 3 [Nitrospirales bacterium]|nr:MAG: ribonuclease 3 [Nitrospirales bacterium]